MDYKPTIGLEIHAELKTSTKMFCDSLNDSEEKHPNVNVCPVCLGYPGTLPTANKQAIEHVIKVGLALAGKSIRYRNLTAKIISIPICRKGIKFRSTTSRSCWAAA